MIDFQNKIMTPVGDMSSNAQGPKAIVFPIPNQQCEKICERREIHKWSKNELEIFKNAILGMYKDGLWRQLVQMHIDASTYAHWNSRFFPWHRAFLAILEKTMQTHYNKNICLPYWDVSKEATSPFESIVWGSEYFGGNGHPQTNCVQSGPFSHFVDNNGGCLQRAFGATSQMSPDQQRQQSQFGYFVDDSTIAKIISDSVNYEDFRGIFELFPHQMMHTSTGGTMRTMGSNLDPIFYVIHGLVDKTWDDFITKQRTQGLQDLYSGSPININEVMLWTRMNPYHILDTESLCYRYATTDPPNLSAVSIQAFPPIPADWLLMNNIKPEEVEKWTNRFKKLLPTQVVNGPSYIALEESPSNTTISQ